ncbi:MAG: hypothetical protein JW732_01440, partial [Dehalococcoidia bacterium]|nr:hypothetical protein [Dehalococcoidia bacterium]
RVILTLLLGNTFFEATIPPSVTIIMSQFDLLTTLLNRFRINPVPMLRNREPHNKIQRTGLAKADIYNTGIGFRI